jgi:hypothetical protein
MLVALLLVHVNVALSPVVIVVGDACRVTVGGLGGGVVLDKPVPHPVKPIKETQRRQTTHRTQERIGFKRIS